MSLNLGLIGCGLIGGSLALGLRRAGVASRVVGYDERPAVTARALELGILNAVATGASGAAIGADVVVLAVPVRAIGAACAAIGPSLGSRAVLTDVGSTKAAVVRAGEAAVGG